MFSQCFHLGILLYTKTLNLSPPGVTNVQMLLCGSTESMQMHLSCTHCTLPSLGDKFRFDCDPKTHGNWKWNYYRLHRSSNKWKWFSSYLDLIKQKLFCSSKKPLQGGLTRLEHGIYSISTVEKKNLLFFFLNIFLERNRVHFYANLVLNE